MARQALALILCVIMMLFFTSWEGNCREAGWVPIEPLKGLKVPTHEKDLTPLQKKSAPRQKSSPARAPASSPGGTVYDNQPPITEKELRDFIKLLPFFRAWAKDHGETAHPVLNRDGNPDFQYSANAAQWVKEHNFEAMRFFCAMGRMAAGVVIVEEGNDFKGTRPPDMPAVSPQELNLVRKYLGALLTAGGPALPIK